MVTFFLNGNEGIKKFKIPNATTNTSKNLIPKYYKNLNKRTK